MSDVLNNAAGVGAVTAATTIASSIDPQMVMMGAEAFTQPSGSETISRLTDTVDVSGLAFVRVLKTRLDEGTVEPVIALPKESSIKYLTSATTVRHGDREDSLLLWQTSPGIELWQFEETPDKRFMIGWAPVVDSGRQVGLVLAGVDVTKISEALKTLLLAIVVTCLVFVLLSGLVTYKFATTFEKTAVTDGLMNIYNHKYFKQRLEQEVAKSNRYGQQTSLVLLDIDFFKKVNDTYGHATGDLVLKQLARIVTDTCRNTDVVARYGGEEIAIILTHTGIAGAQEFAERLRLKVSQHVVRDPEEDAEFRVTVSIGVAQCEKGVNMMDLIRRTDAALYHSKRTGRNRVTLYQEDILMPPEEAQTKPKLR
jgi:diguanylate cyclase (GGDEF)-like protein